MDEGSGWRFWKPSFALRVQVPMSRGLCLSRFGIPAMALDEYGSG